MYDHRTANFKVLITLLMWLSHSEAKQCGKSGNIHISWSHKPPFMVDTSTDSRKRSSHISGCLYDIVTRMIDRCCPSTSQVTWRPPLDTQRALLEDLQDQTFLLPVTQSTAQTVAMDTGTQGLYFLPVIGTKGTANSLIICSMLIHVMLNIY